MKHIQVIPFVDGNSLVIYDLNENGVIWNTYDHKNESFSEKTFSSVKIAKDCVSFRETKIQLHIEVYETFMKQRKLG